MDSQNESQANPYTELKLWIMFEQFEIVALLEVIKKRRVLQETNAKCFKQMLGKLDTLQTLETGGNTFSTFFKSKTAKEKLIVEMQSQKHEWQAAVVNSRLHF
jgi:hypothetical protein